MVLLDRASMQTLIGSRVLHLICLSSTPRYSYKIKVPKSSVAHVLEHAGSNDIFVRLWSPSRPQLSTPPCNSAYTLSNPPDTGAGTSISILSWNCRGISNSQPYMDQLFRDRAHIIAPQEHWLWPFELDKLSSSQHLCTAKSDNRLNESSQLSVGCGGVAIQWKKHLCCTPLSDITSDRIVVSQ